MLRDDTSRVLMRFVWNVPLASSASSCARSICTSRIATGVQGAAENWPADNYIPPYVRDADERSNDFGLVNQGYLGYMTLGYSAREVEMFVWLEALRDKQCEDKPCEGVYLCPASSSPRRLPGQDPYSGNAPDAWHRPLP